jgi:hypothetical protein
MAMRKKLDRDSGCHSPCCSLHSVTQRIHQWNAKLAINPNETEQSRAPTQRLHDSVTVPAAETA